MVPQPIEEISVFLFNELQDFGYLNRILDLAVGLASTGRIEQTAGMFPATPRAKPDDFTAATIKGFCVEQTDPTDQYLPVVLKPKSDGEVAGKIWKINDVEHYKILDSFEIQDSECEILEFDTVDANENPIKKMIRVFVYKDPKDLEKVEFNLESRDSDNSMAEWNATWGETNSFIDVSAESADEKVKRPDEA